MYILNSKKDILDEIKNKMNDFDELFIAVSFITNEGFKTLFDLKSMNHKVKIITTTEEYITDPLLLSKLKSQGCKIKIISSDLGKRSFHSKFMISRKGSEYFSVLGSLNITKHALLNKYESVIVDHEPKKLLDHFNYLWQVGDSLTKEYLESYFEKFIKYKNEIKPFIADLNKRINIRPNEMQLGVLDELRELYKDGENKALLYSATGTGKTFLAAFHLKERKFKKTLFIVHSRLIIKSAIRDFAVVFSDKNLLELKTTNRKLVVGSDIVFTTQKTINRIRRNDKNFLNQFDHVIFDESHKIGPLNEQGKILKDVLDINKSFVLAMSATPWRSDDPDFIIDMFDNNVVGNIDLSKAIEEGFVCDFTYSGIDVDVDFNVENLKIEDLTQMVNKFIDTLDKKEVWDSTKVKGILFTKNIKEADLVTKEINDKYKYNAVSVHSKMTGELDVNQSEEIVEYINRLQNDSNPLNFIVTVDMFNEGVDIPRINTIGMFRFTNSRIIYSQQIGRGLRKEGSDKKYLNIIDLVGNHENSYERIIGLMGKVHPNPNDVVEYIENLDEKKFILSDVSREKILNNIAKKIKYKKYFDETIKYLKSYKSIIPEIHELSTYLNEEIQVIANNYRKTRHFTQKSRSWIEELYSVITDEYKGISNIESGLIEMFSWLPITATDVNEKKKIDSLLNGEGVILEEKWHKYFYGDHDNKWRFVYGDYRKYFTKKGDKLFFDITLIKNDSTLKLLNKIKEYLSLNSNVNDKMKNTWYSKFEINFMSGRANRDMNANLKVKGDEGKVFIVNSIDKKYENKVLTKNEYIISTRGKKHYDTNLTYFNFMGKKIFHTNEMYFYVGEQAKPLKFNGYNKKENNVEYATFIFESKDELSESNYRYLNIK